MKLRQVHLIYKPPFPYNGVETHLKTWVEDDPAIKVGTRLELKGDDTIWTVLEVFSNIEASSINRNWGLDLPKSQRTER